MKCLTLYLHAAFERDVVDRLRTIECVSGFTLSDCRGHSRHTGRDRAMAARDRVEGYAPRVRLEVMLEEADVDAVLEALGGCTSGLGQGEMGAWFVSDVGRSGRL